MLDLYVVAGILIVALRVWLIVRRPVQKIPPPFLFDFVFGFGITN
jgi:hypothetical protein